MAFVTQKLLLARLPKKASKNLETFTKVWFCPSASLNMVYPNYNFSRIVFLLMYFLRKNGYRNCANQQLIVLFEF